MRYYVNWKEEKHYIDCLQAADRHELYKILPKEFCFPKERENSPRNDDGSLHSFTVNDVVAESSNDNRIPAAIAAIITSIFTIGPTYGLSVVICGLFYIQVTDKYRDGLEKAQKFNDSHVNLKLQ